jgi:hypothetical protein
MTADVGPLRTVFAGLNRRRHPRSAPAYVAGQRVEVLDGFVCRLGPGTLRHICRNGRGGLIVDLDSGHDVLVPRRFVRAL